MDLAPLKNPTGDFMRSFIWLVSLAFLFATLSVGCEGKSRTTGPTTEHLIQPKGKGTAMHGGRGMPDLPP